MNDKKNLAVDLRRICLWLVKGNDKLADQFLRRDIKLYKDMDVKIGKTKIGDWLELIINRSDGQEKAAERALTAAAILS